MEERTHRFLRLAWSVPQAFVAAPSWLARRLRFAVPPGSEADTARDCIHCGCRLTAGDSCGVCGLDHQGDLANELTDLAATERQLARFLTQARIDDATFQRLQETIGEERRRLLHRLPHPESLKPQANRAAAEQTPTSHFGAVRKYLTNGVALAVGLMLAVAALGCFSPGHAFLFGLALYVPLTLEALRRGRPALHFAAAVPLLLGFSAFVLKNGEPYTLLSPRHGWLLLASFVFAEAVALLLRRRGRTNHAVRYALIGLMTACAGIGLIAGPSAGVHEPASAALACACVAAVGLAVNRRWRVPMIGAWCIAFLLAATFWALWWLAPKQIAGWSGALALEALLLRLLSLRRSHLTAEDANTSSVREPFVCGAFAIAVLAVLTACSSAWLVPGWSVYQVATGLLLCGFLAAHSLSEQSKPAAVLAGVCLLLAFLATGGLLAAITAELPFGPSTWAATGLGTAAASLVLARVALLSGERPASGVAILTACRLPAAIAASLTVSLAVVPCLTDTLTLPGYDVGLAVGALLLLARAYQRPLWSHWAAVLAWATIGYSLIRPPATVLPMLPLVAALAPVTQYTPRLLYAAAAALQVNVFAVLIWKAFGTGSWESFVYTQALCCPLAAIAARVITQRTHGDVTALQRVWFDRVQLATGVVVALLSTWVSLDEQQNLAMRLWAPASLALIVPSLLLVLPSGKVAGAAPAPSSFRWLTPNGIRYATLFLGFLAACEVGWALLDTTAYPATTLLLHRGVVAAAASALAGVAYLFVLPRIGRLPDAWKHCAGVAGLKSAWLSAAVVAGVVAFEAYCYRPTTGVVPMPVWAVLVVCLLLAAYVLIALRWACLAAQAMGRPGASGRERQLYAALAGVFVLFAHCRLTLGGSGWFTGLTASAVVVALALAWEWSARSTRIMALVRSSPRA